MKWGIIFMAILATISTEEIPDTFKPLQTKIFNRLVAPGDGAVERDIKSLFAQYIILAAMEAANSTQSTTPTESPIIFKTTTPVPSVEQAKTHLQQTQVAPQQAPPQIIYVYVTAPTQAPRVEEPSKIKTKKPPKTKKPHHNAQVQQSAPAAAVVQHQPQVVPQPVYVQVQQQPIRQQPPPPQHIYIQQQQQQPDDAPQQSIVSESDIAPPSQQVSPVTTAPVIAQRPIYVPILTPGAGSAQAKQPIPVTAAPTLPPITHPTPSPEHVLNQVDQILINVAKGNITGIVDQSLAIRAPMPVRNLVNGILNTIFCNPINRILGRCRG